MYVKIPQNAVDAILTPPLTLNGHMVDTKTCSALLNVIWKDINLDISRQLTVLLSYFDTFSHFSNIIDI